VVISSPPFCSVSVFGYEFFDGGVSTPSVVVLVLFGVLFFEGLEWFCFLLAAMDLVLLLVQASWWCDSEGSVMEVTNLGMLVAAATNLRSR
jgi:hypothetical protein